MTALDEALNRLATFDPRRRGGLHHWRKAREKRVLDSRTLQLLIDLFVIEVAAAFRIAVSMQAESSAARRFDKGGSDLQDYVQASLMIDQTAPPHPDCFRDRQNLDD